MRARTSHARQWLCGALVFLMMWSQGASAWADPCGMVPPIWLGDGAPIVRVGDQKTYVFYKNGIETLVLRPGFSGKVDEFGMLIPFPSPPAIRKVADDVFGHLAAAIDPPEVVIDLRWNYRLEACCDAPAGAKEEREVGLSMKRRDQVSVLREEAVGMYEVAVLEAGSARALKRWLDDHGFQYPEGMDATCEEYVSEGWCFVAVKARVGEKQASEARPGMREVDPSLPDGAGFDGHVQAMGFRFRTEELVVPMRLSAFNEGELHNIVYILSDSPKRIVDIPEHYVVRQIAGSELYRNLTDPLPLRVIGGSLDQIPDWRRQSLPTERNPIFKNGIARELFASDLLAVSQGRLTHEYEEREKQLLDISERLGLRGTAIDALHAQVLEEERERVVAEALNQLHGMTLTVVDGDFEREVLARQNLTFSDYAMAQNRNDKRVYDAKSGGPAPILGGTLGGVGGGPFSSSWTAAMFALLLSLFGLCVLRSKRTRVPLFSAAALALTLSLASTGTAAGSQIQPDRIGPGVLYPMPRIEITPLPDIDRVAELVAQALAEQAPVQSGRAILELVNMGGEPARRGLELVQQMSGVPLVQTWAAAARIQLAGTAEQLASLSDGVNSLPALDRPLSKAWVRTLGQTEGLQALEIALEVISRLPVLQQSVLPAAIAQGPQSLLRVLFTAETNGARNLAAACLATAASRGEEQIAWGMVEALRFDPRAELVPWEGGALFIPGLSWQRDEARQLVSQLIAWHLWCDLKGRSAEKTQLHNNLRSLGLAQAADYQSPGWQEVDTDRWLLVWGQAAGRAELVRIFLEQGVWREERFQKILAQLSD